MQRASRSRTARLDPVTSLLRSTDWTKLKASEKVPDAGRARIHTLVANSTAAGCSYSCGVLCSDA
jgi:hypothetical protein